ncbi:acyltransferase family protein [Rubricoccus marinus]|uniref:Acyltransferase n=1 Tax=Rubricoccus marinus TaxID=716817 RepID=A0A259U0E0_9BACT|nr:acyltransferase family protein [Rubricoccus marinus]OZC03406.1 hypothetical protein BSZ36_10685 [Rubricoccus marinus]
MSVGEGTATPRPTWRQDIQGLRGIAVLLVVLYHAGVPGFSGGYIGVDVFFVLSGYLITGLLVREVNETGRVDLWRFYARRARRLLPAAAALIVGVALFAAVFYAPVEQALIARTALATAAYASNLLFVSDATDYLAAGAETNPLLHTWSLAVEEQFYIAWPLLVGVLLAGWAAFRKAGAAPRHRQRLVWGAALVSLLSFGFMLALMGSRYAHWAFFFSPARAWEFGLGALAVLAPQAASGARGDATDNGEPARGLAGLRFEGGSDPVSPLAHALGWAGLIAVLASGVAFTTTTPFPGWAALLPTVGTALALRGGTAATRTALARTLAWRPLQELGRLSYSWYLWHWPVLVFAAGLYGELPLATRVALALGSLLLAEVSYRFIENPVRHNRWFAASSRRGLGLLAGVTVLSLVIGGGWYVAARGLAESPRHRALTNVLKDVPDLYERECQRSTVSDTLGEDCTDVFASGENLASGADSTPTVQAPETGREVVLLGDSHAAQWAPALQAIAKQRGWTLSYHTKSGCAPLGVSYVDPRLDRIYTECETWTGLVMDSIRAARPDLVVLAISHQTPISPEAWREGMDQTLVALAEASGDVVVFRDTPWAPTDTPVCLSRQEHYAAFGRTPDPSSCDFAADHDSGERVYAILKASARARGASVLDLTDLVCPGGTCTARRGEMVTFRDPHHITATYAEALAEPLARELDRVVPSRAASPEAEG